MPGPGSASARSQRVDTPSRRAIGPNGSSGVRVASMPLLKREDALFTRRFPLS